MLRTVSGRSLALQKAVSRVWIARRACRREAGTRGQATHSDRRALAAAGGGLVGTLDWLTAALDQAGAAYILNGACAAWLQGVVTQPCPPAEVGQQGRVGAGPSLQLLPRPAPR
jgi:hypothetical protein